MTDPRLAELAALEGFTLEDWANEERTLADTYAAHAPDREALRREIIRIVPDVVRPEDLTFESLADGTVRVSLAVLVTPEGFARSPPVSDD